jgi:hypothetical protein
MRERTEIRDRAMEHRGACGLPGSGPSHISKSTAIAGHLPSARSLFNII